MSPEPPSPPLQPPSRTLPEPPPGASAPGLEARFTDIEARLIEQEHRWVGVAMNLHSAFSQHPSGDARRSAALRAVLWRLFSPATVLGAGIGLVSILGLLIALQANHLLSLQNKRIDQQTLLLEAQRRAGLVTEFTAVVEQVQKEREQTRGARARRAQKGVPEPRLVLSGPTVGRIVALSRSYRPYLYLEIDGDADASLVVAAVPAAPVAAESSGLIDTLNRSLGFDLKGDGERPVMTRVALSPERGQLLIALHNGEVDLEPLTRQSVDFSRADLRNAVLAGARLANANMTRAALAGADLLNVNFTGAFLAGANLSRACLTGVNFSGALMQSVNLSGTSLSRAIIMNAEQLEGADLSGARLEDLYVSGREWLDLLQGLKPPVTGFVRADWTLAPVTRPGTIRMLELKVGSGATEGWYQVKAAAGALQRYPSRAICA